MKYNIVNTTKQEATFRAASYNGTIAGEYYEGVGTMAHPKGGVRRIDKDHYEVISTGEVREYNRKSDAECEKHIKNLKRTMLKLMQLFRANFTGGINELFLTLTYRENSGGR